MQQGALNGTVLVVDDDERILKLVSLGLRRAGYEVTLASNGKEALNRISEATPDLIVSDVMMPDMDGFALLSALRSDPATQTIPLVFLTARGSTDDLVTGLGLGADDYLAKPFDMNELLARVRSKVERPPVPSELLPQHRQTGLLNEHLFWQETERELVRTRRGGKSGVVAYLDISELSRLRERFGNRSIAQISKEITRLIGVEEQPLDVAGHDDDGRFLILMPETDSDQARRRLKALSQALASHAFLVSGERLVLTPVISFVPFDVSASTDELRERALLALDYGAAHLDLEPVRYDPKVHIAHPGKEAAWWSRLAMMLRSPAQVVGVHALALVVPFALYVFLYRFGIDVAVPVYIVVVASLVITGFLIWIEGLYALRPVQPPEKPASTHPPASAIIAAYLPNEAATVVETIEAFLRVEYPGPLQIILAYNTPKDMPVESILQDIARRDARFVPYRVQRSTSKAQNVNAALAEVSGEFVGVFDADHQPNPDSFSRAWRWLSNGYDVVQGHSVVRNGEESWVARMVAVEFESIYAVSHPGRARMHGFGIFGGSNGYWKTDLLRRTRMRGFMLTEDIDSALRTVEAGYKIASDPLLVSRELAPTTLKALWNQRMRWAQGWFQVSLKHLLLGLRSPKLSLRQKFGFFQLLGWREIYPWISVQIFPVIAFWAWKYGGLSNLDWFVPIFVLTTIFTLSVGPGQTLFAYLLGVPELRQHKRWFLFYLFVSSLFYTEGKNVVNRVAQAKEVTGEKKWKVTPRASTKDSG